jgi:protein-tyrosine phosphatase
MRTPPVIDLHVHILPGVDDGPRTLDESVALARALVADGVLVATATPHVRADYPTTADVIEQGVTEVRAALADAAVPLDVRPGAEIGLELLGSLQPDELRRLRLGGDSCYLLLEFPYSAWPFALAAHVSTLRARGFTAVLAHPERNADVQAAPERLRTVVDQGALVQLTAASLNGCLGQTSQAAAFALLDRNLAHLVASDAHGPDVRRARLSTVASAVRDETLARWLTTDVPAAMLAGKPIPERPVGRRPPRSQRFLTRLAKRRP